MADKTLRSITFPGLPDRYVIPEQVSIDATLSQQGKAADAKAVGDALKAQIAPAYSTSGTYAVGDLVLYNNALYRCKTAITTAEAWTPAHWEATTINDVARKVTDLESASMELDASKAPVIIQEASGSVASFSDGADGLPMKSLVAAIEPVQDLHGYDHPWPGGASKNKLDLTRAAGTYTFTGVTFVINDDGTIKCNGTNTGSEILFNFTDIIPNNFNGDILSGAVSSNLGIACTFYQTSTGTFVSSRVDGGNGATLDSDAPYCRFAVRVPAGSTVNGTVKPMVRLASESDATFVPYKNICPITGWTGLSGKRTGKNLACVNYMGRMGPGVLIDFIDSTITLNGVGTSSNAQAWISDGFILYPGIYTVSHDFNGDLVLLIGGWGRSDTIPSGAVRTFTITEPIQVTYGVKIVNGVTYDNVVVHVQLELGSTASDYEPYEGDTISVNWQTEAGTVYGGTVDVVTGKLTVDHAMIDLGTLGWNKTTGASAQIARFFANSLVDVVKKVPNGTVANVLCEIYKIASANQGYAGDVVDCITVDSTGSVSCYPTASYVDATAFQNAMSGIKFVYELATPQTYQLTPQEVTTLLGNNVVYTDVGPVSVTAPRDTKMYVDNKIAEAVAAALNA